MNRMFAIIEREMRKFFRSPTLMIMSLMLPILQLIIIGNAFGGKIVCALIGCIFLPGANPARQALAPAGNTRGGSRGD